mmetsp:Transcript_23838/g.39292  ORF Transcript_23838/g.39292 Transcript_23838/m.39292 type:complete len:95 (+) Transcript_23838:5801-6085(+)
MFPSNPACKAANQTSLSNGVGAEHRTCVPEYVTSKKSADLTAGDDNSEDKLPKSLFGEPFWGVKKLDFFVAMEGGFHADAPTILISDVGGSPLA